jgi:hypothetical protein
VEEVALHGRAPPGAANTVKNQRHLLLIPCGTRLPEAESVPSGVANVFRRLSDGAKRFYRNELVSGIDSRLECASGGCKLSF